MIIVTDPKQICLNAGCMANLSFDTDQADFVCGLGHRFSSLDEHVPVVETERDRMLDGGAVQVLSRNASKLESPPKVEVLEAVPVRSAAMEKRPEEVRATGIPVRRSTAKPKEFGDELGNRWVELPNGDVCISLVVPQHHASALRATVEGGQWAGGDPLQYFADTVIRGFDENWFW